jgi:hypothetical protein
MNKTITFQVDKKMASALKKAASQEFCSIGAVIRKAVYTHLQGYVDPNSCRETAKSQGE